MALFSPAKLLVVLVVALIVLGPDQLPKVARQIGALLSEFRNFRDKLDSEVRETFPDLPSTDTIAQAVRSPLRFMDQMSGAAVADTPSQAGPRGIAESIHGTPAVLHPDRSASTAATHDGLGVPRGDDHAAVVHEIGPDRVVGSEHPGMN